MTYDNLLAQYLKMNPGAEVSTPDGQQAFNNWTGTVAQQFGANNWESIPDSAFGSNPFVNDTLATTVNNTLLTGAQRAGEGGNTNQVQGGFQTGQFGTTGKTEQIGNTQQTGTNTQQGTTTSTGTTGQTGTSTNTGRTTTSTDQTAVSNGTRTVNDTLGFGKLLQSQAGNAVQSDATRSRFLTDLVDTGGKQFQDQVDFAANRSLSGPGMVGVGDGARGRVAGAAVGDVARNNLSQRLEASGQLAGPTAVGTLAEKGNAYLGESTQGTTRTTGTSVADTSGTTQFNQTGTSTGATTSNATGTSETLGLSKLLGTESNTGTSNAASTQIATGQVPEGKTTTGGGGGCMVCTMYVDFGMMHPGAVRRGVRFKLNNLKTYRSNVEGYMLYGPWIVKFLQRHGNSAVAFRPVARAILYEECRLASPSRYKRRLGPTLAHAMFLGVSAVAARIGRAFGHSGRVEDTSVETMLRRNRLFYTF